jgi:hypothetical protein
MYKLRVPCYDFVLTRTQVDWLLHFLLSVSTIVLSLDLPCQNLIQRQSMHI